jgi:uncharacterized membrane protein
MSTKSADRGSKHGVTDEAEDLAPVVRHNIEALVGRRREWEEARRAHHRVADWLSATVGTLWFVLAQLALVVAWLGLSRGSDFDPDLAGLGTTAAVESIFLTAFVLISQNRMQALADERAELDVQMTMLAEHEITRLMRLVDAVAEKLDVPAEQEDRQDIEHLVEEVEPEQVLDELDSSREDE